MIFFLLSSGETPLIIFCQHNLLQYYTSITSDACIVRNFAVDIKSRVTERMSSFLRPSALLIGLGFKEKKIQTMRLTFHLFRTNTKLNNWKNVQTIGFIVKNHSDNVDGTNASIW